MQLKIYFVLTIVSFNLMHTIQKRSLHFNSALITLRNYPWIFFFFFVYFSKKILVIFISSCNYEFCTNIKKKKSNIYRLHVNTLFIHSRSNRKRNSSTIQKFANKVRPIFAKKEKGREEKKIASSRKSNQLEISSKTPSNHSSVFLSARIGQRSI